MKVLWSRAETYHVVTQTRCTRPEANSDKNRHNRTVGKMAKVRSRTWISGWSLRGYSGLIPKAFVFYIYDQMCTYDDDWISSKQTFGGSKANMTFHIIRVEWQKKRKTLSTAHIWFFYLLSGKILAWNPFPKTRFSRLLNACRYS